MPAVLRRASRSSSTGESDKALPAPDLHRELPLREAIFKTQQYDGFIMQQYMNKLGSSNHGDTGHNPAAAPTTDEEAQVVSTEPAVPPRLYVRSKGWSTTTLVVFMIACTGYFFYDMTTRILRTQAWNAIPMLVLMPIEMLYFSYAAATMVNGLWNLLGEPRYILEACCLLK